MSTANTQLLLIWSLIALGLFTIVNGILTAYVARKSRDLATVKLDVSELFERVEALQDRFTRFQKREGMREARKEKTSAADLKAEAEAIVAQAGAATGGLGQPAGAGSHPKLDLYRRGH